jgi:glycosyltransferase involved in cell wall biosynthesis
VPTGDPDALTDAVAGVVSDPARSEQMGDVGRRTMERCFSPSRIAERLAGCYEALWD